MNDLIFKSKVDIWLLVVIDIAAFLSCYATIQQGGAWTIVAGKLVLVAALVAYVTYVLFYIKYEFRGDHLLIYYQPFIKRSIKICEIKQVEATCNPLSAPAASLDRLKLTYAGGWTLISPRDKEGFVAHLQKCNPSIKVEL